MDSEVFYTFSDGPDFLVCFASGYISLPMPVLQEPPIHFLDTQSQCFTEVNGECSVTLVTSLLQPPVIQPQPHPSHLSESVLGLYGICYSSYTRAPPVSKSQPPFPISLCR